MKYKKLAMVIAVVIAVALAVVAGLIVRPTMNKNHKAANTKSTAAPQVISGRVTHISNACQSDGTCSVTLDDTRSIVTGCGLAANGKTCKSYDQSKLRLGQHVTATVVTGEPGWYTLECAECTIQVIGGPIY